MTESSFLKSHKQFVKTHLNRRSIEVVASKHQYAHRSRYKKPRIYKYPTGFNHEPVHIKKVLIEVFQYFSAANRNESLPNSGDNSPKRHNKGGR